MDLRRVVEEALGDGWTVTADGNAVAVAFSGDWTARMVRGVGGLSLTVEHPDPDRLPAVLRSLRAAVTGDEVTPEYLDLEAASCEALYHADQVAKWYAEGYDIRDDVADLTEALAAYHALLDAACAEDEG